MVMFLMSDDRKLSDEDVIAIVEQLKTQLVSDFYGEVGKGIWTVFKQMFLICLCILAIYGVIAEKGVLSRIIQN